MPKKVTLTKPKLNREAKFVNVNYTECEKWIGVYFALVFCRLLICTEGTEAINTYLAASLIVY